MYINRLNNYFCLSRQGISLISILKKLTECSYVSEYCKGLKIKCFFMENRILTVREQFAVSLLSTFCLVFFPVHLFLNGRHRCIRTRTTINFIPWPLEGAR